MKLKDYIKKIEKKENFKKPLNEKRYAFLIGLEIERLRYKRGLTQTQLARKMRTRQPSIARLENGNGLPSLSFLFRVAKALDVEPQQLLIPEGIDGNLLSAHTGKSATNAGTNTESIILDPVSSELISPYYRRSADSKIDLHNHITEII